MGLVKMTMSQNWTFTICYIYDGFQVVLMHL